MLFLKGITTKLFKGAIFMCSDMHAIPEVPIQVALIEIQNRICPLKVVFTGFSLMNFTGIGEAGVKLHSLTPKLLI